MDRLQVHTKEKAAKTGIFIKKKKVQRKAYKFEDKSLTTVLESLPHFKPACAFNGGSKEMNLCVLPEFRNDGAESGLFEWMQMGGERYGAYPLQKIGE